MNRRENTLRKRIYALTSLMIVGLVVSGVTAIPVKTEIDLLARTLPVAEGSWIAKVRDALHAVHDHHPFLFYGTDWLAFGHIVIAVAFIGALRHPTRNRWLFDFGLIACVMVIPYALIMGSFRGIPLWWKLIDCSFGVLGAIPMILCRRYVQELESLNMNPTGHRVAHSERSESGSGDKTSPCFKE
jgi:hypothetical protein